MSPVFQHWSTDPFDLAVCLVVVVHVRGLRARLRLVRRANRPTTPWLQQAALFYAGLAVLIVAVTSPIDYWSERYLSAHIVQHLLLAFFAPPLIVLGAPWVPLMRGLPRPLRRRLGRLMQLSRSGSPGASGPVRRLIVSIRRVMSRPITAVILFNVTMVFWHLPGPFDAALTNQAVHIWLEHASFLGFGIALWFQIFGSYPLRPILDGPRRVAALVTTNAVMVLVAMTLAMFTKAIYIGYDTVHTLAQRAADQQIGGSILWVCGEVSFLPAILYTVMRWLDTESAQSLPAHLQSPDPIPVPPKLARSSFIQ